MKSTAQKRPHPKPQLAPRAPARHLVTDARLVALALALIMAALVFLRLQLHPSAPLNWSYQVVLLCLLLAALAARFLLSNSGTATELPHHQHLPDNSRQQFGSCPRIAQPLALSAVLLAAIVPFLPTLGIGFLSDDFGLSASVAKLRGLADVFRMNPFLGPFAGLYRPLHVLVWWTERHLWGDAPLGYHLVNLLLHACNAGLAYALGRRIMKSLPAALLAGLLFAVHPLHTETVAWAVCQADLQCTLLALLSLLCLDAYLHTRRPLTLAAAVAFFFLALLTKESALALPGVAVVWAWLRRRDLDSPHAEAPHLRSVVWVGACYAVALAAYLAVRIVMLGRFGGYRSAPGFWNTVFPSAPLREALTFFLPVNQSLLTAAGGVWLLALAVVVMAGFFLWCLLNLSRLPGSRLALYGSFALLLSISVWMVPWPSADLEYSRFAYLPTVALCWLVGDLLTQKRSLRAPAVVLAVSLALSLWYVTPWLAAGRLAQKVVTAGEGMVAQAPPSAQPPVFYVQNLPDLNVGAQVFRNAYPQALAAALGRPVLVQTVSPGGDVPPEMMLVSPLLPGEYLFAWEGKTGTMNLVREGRP